MLSTIYKRLKSIILGIFSEIGALEQSIVNIERLIAIFNLGTFKLFKCLRSAGYDRV